jgi:hypothetical protein
MKITPLDKTTILPVALLTPGRRTLHVQTVDSITELKGRRQIERGLERLAGHRCYLLGSPSKMIHTTGALSWLCYTWKGRETRIVHVPSGCTVHSLRGHLDHVADPFDDLIVFLRWLRGYGVAPSSIPSMAWQLFRASLAREYVVGFDDAIGRAALYGGRQEARSTGVHSSMVSYDIRAAYPVAMASRPYALDLMKVANSTGIDPSQPGIAVASVDVDPSLPYPPLPVRIMEDAISFQHGHIEGTWSWCELAAAHELGCKVTILENYAPRRIADLFGSWWPLVAEGRSLPRGAGILAKAVSTATWGQFGMVASEKGRKTWIDDNGSRSLTVLEEEHNLPQTWTAHIAAETTARVRTRMLREGLYSSGCSPIYVDTDGIIATADSPCPGPSGSAPGDWRLKDEMPTVEVRGPQLYRWTCSGCGVDHAEWHYNASGIPADEAPAFFAVQRPMMIDVELRRDFDESLVKVANAARGA